LSPLWRSPENDALQQIRDHDTNSIQVRKIDETMNQEIKIHNLRRRNLLKDGWAAC
jgi:hypothetical protein